MTRRHHIGDVIIFNLLPVTPLIHSLFFDIFTCHCCGPRNKRCRLDPLKPVYVYAQFLGFQFVFGNVLLCMILMILWVILDCSFGDGFYFLNLFEIFCDSYLIKVKKGNIVRRQSIFDVQEFLDR